MIIKHLEYKMKGIEVSTLMKNILNRWEYLMKTWLFQLIVNTQAQWVVK